MLSIVGLICWIIIGAIVFTSDKVTKFDFGLAWICVVLNLITDVISEVC